MAADDPMNWMWSEAMAMLAQAERMRAGAFAPWRAAGRSSWEPPVDVFETETEVLVMVALPGVGEQEVEAVIEGAALVVRGRRVLPAQLRDAFVHRLELPRGPFERRIPLPSGRYDAHAHTMRDGCLLVRLRKAV